MKPATANVTLHPPAFRAATVDDGKRMHEFVAEHGVLELNTAYAYLILAKHFGRHCLVVESDELADNALAGFVLAYRPPTATEEIFVWQIGVHPELRGRGLAKTMLQELRKLPANCDAQFVTATVATDNAPSRALFRGLAKELGVTCEESVGLTREQFHGNHEAEDLFRVGPFHQAR